MLTWVKDKEVFLKKYSFVSICMWGNWSLVILCHEEEDDLPFIMLLDSLHSIDPTKLVRPIQRFLKDIYATKNKAVIADAMSSIDISIPSLTYDWFSRAEFEKFVHDLIIRKIEVQEMVVEVSKKKHRGATKLSSVHGLDNGKRIVVQINELGQPVGEGDHSLKLFLGTIARLGDKMSIDAPTWRTMSATHKDDVWEYVQLEEESRAMKDPLVEFFAAEEARKYLTGKENRQGELSVHGVSRIRATIGHACMLMKEELEEYMSYDVGAYCEDDWLLGQWLIVGGCDPLPRRRYLARAPPDFWQPQRLGRYSLWRTPEQCNAARWEGQWYGNVSCISSNSSSEDFSSSGCTACVEMEKERLRWAAGNDSRAHPADFLMGMSCR
ncbi:hypothetical protein Taro_037081 [Colocasia esculenta]|uniref:Uncharacterized protein n=1 Tax=Colocasia esculenta TaxID=4460 RepID=A0A843WI57_COLES|nr:hypothetical protein [Colocasia esculenta]